MPPARRLSRAGCAIAALLALTACSNGYDDTVRADRAERPSSRVSTSETRSPAPVDGMGSYPVAPTAPVGTAGSSTTTTPPTTTTSITSGRPAPPSTVVTTTSTTTSTTAAPTTTTTTAPTTTTTRPAGAVIVARDFSLTSVTVAPGASVRVENQGQRTHTVTADGGAFDSGRVSAGGATTITAPSVPGSYAFHCELHASMTGTLTVAG